MICALRVKKAKFADTQKWVNEDDVYYDFIEQMAVAVPLKKPRLLGALASAFVALVGRDTPETEERSNAISIAMLLGVTLFGIAVSLEVDLF
ncbi:hypothetical protein N7522_010000 [Penicillium canescens]|nr:hypothetical protein N7522_010000 [Penicillium canescens]